MTHVETVEFEPGDPHNDQMAARANDELDQHLKSVRDTLRQANGSATDAMVVVAVTLINNGDLYPRDRLASILAAAFVRLAGLPPVDGHREKT